MAEGDSATTSIPYSWTQTLRDVSVTVPLPSGTRGRDLLCTIKKDSLLVKLKSATEPIIEGQLHKLVKPGDSFWSIDDGALLIELQKVNTMEWWSCVIVGHPEIDTTKIEPENSKLDELDDDTRAMVTKMMFDQRQKAMGQPTSDELQRQEILNKFMAQHPEMDFSQAKFS